MGDSKCRGAGRGEEGKEGGARRAGAVARRAGVGAGVGEGRGGL